jgi:hypothetical protein
MTRLLFGPRLDSRQVTRVVPRQFRATGEALAYDDFVDARHSDALGIGTGSKTTLIFDPGRQLEPAVLDRWRVVVPTGPPVVVIDLNETTDDYAIEIHGDGATHVRRWVKRQLVSTTDAGPVGLRFPKTGSAKNLLSLVARLGHGENPLNWEFAVRPRTTSRRAIRRSKLDAIAAGPPFLRMLFVEGRDPKRLLTKLSRYARLEYREPLDLDNLLHGCMSASQIAVAGCSTYSALFDESGSLAFDVRWLGPDFPPRMLAVWGHFEAPHSSPNSLNSLRQPPIVGFARYERDTILRRITWAGGRETTAAPGIPASLLAEKGGPLEDEALLTRAKAGGTFADVAPFLARSGFDPERIPTAKFGLFRVQPK